ncbi:hypothetical protein D3C85_1447510 [compost metagenome]
MPQALSSMTNTTGSFHRAARFSVSWKAPWLAAPSPIKATATPGLPCSWRDSAAPTAGPMPSAMIPEQEKFTRASNRCIWPPRPPDRPAFLPKISASISLRCTPLATAMWCGRWVAVTMSSAFRCAQTPTAQGSWPLDRCISPGIGPLAMLNTGVLPSM